MAVYLLPEEPVFPPVDEAEPDGLIAIGGDLSVERLIHAYSLGIFPWFMENDEVFWFSPDPRMILFPDQLNIPESLKRVIRSNKFVIKFDTVFDQVIQKCAEVRRPGQDGTWISPGFIEAYIALHKQGFAHSVEVFYHDKLAGGLYGVSLGSAFFGESMFYTMNNASKVAFLALVNHCRQFGFKFIDCQVETPHMRALGASLIDRKGYLALLEESIQQDTIKAPWKYKLINP
jgi:leucyl/phenylalanyl-tRNA--protein transferase